MTKRANSEQVEKTEVLSSSGYEPKGHRVYELQVGKDQLYMVQVRGIPPSGEDPTVLTVIPALAPSTAQACKLVETIYKPGRRGVLSLKATRARVHQLVN